jgi:hypothetical protein
MEQVEITWQRSLKVWWSYSWRVFVLMLVVIVPLDIIMFSLVLTRIPKPGVQSDPAETMKAFRAMAILWPIFMAAMVAAQVLAMRWMLRGARWSDFRLAVLPRE